MKTRFLVVLLSTLLITSGTFAQYKVALPTINSSAHGRAYNDAWLYRAVETLDNNDRIWWYAAASAVYIASGENTWEHSNTGLDTYTTAGGGTTGIMRGSLQSNVRLEINHILKGRIYALNSSGLGNTTDIVGKDNPNQSSITGFSTGSILGERSSRADNAITMNTDGNTGSFNFDEGNFVGGAGFAGGHLVEVNAIDIKGTSFVAGKNEEPTKLLYKFGTTDASENPYSYAASGLWIGTASSLTISNHNSKSSDRFEASTIGSEEKTIEGSGTVSGIARGSWFVGGDGLTANTVSGTSEIWGGSFIGSQQNKGTTRSVSLLAYASQNANANTSGGHGANFKSGNGALTIHDGRFLAGDAGRSIAGGRDATATSIGGSGLSANGKGVVTISGGYYKASNGGAASIEKVEQEDGTFSDANGTADAMGGSGIRILSAGATTISNVESYGGNASSARSSSSANATGGSGILLSETTATINSGTFVGGNGGNASGNSSVSAFGGAGALVSGGGLTINGGKFTGGRGGSANNSRQMGNVGVWAQDADLEINQTSADVDTIINGDILFNNSTTKNLNILGGTIEGDIYKTGAGTAAMTISENASYTGAFIQREGNVSITLTDSAQSKFFSNVRTDTGDITFTGAKVLLSGANFSLGGVSNTLDFGTAGVVLGKGTHIDGGFNTVKTAGDLEIGKGSSLRIAYNAINQIYGTINVTGALITTNDNSKIYAGGISATADGTYTVATAGSVVGITASNFNDKVVVDFGWLTQVSSNDLTAGIKVDYEYSSLTNSTLSDLGTILTNIDAVILGSSTTNFFEMNSLGAANGDKLFRFSLSQLPDVSESSFQISQQLNQQIAARGTEFRSMNGFASSKPKFGTSPTGVAGPQNELDQEKTMQGWIRAYGGKGSKDASDKFSEYDTSSWGTVIGVDKSFGKLLVGLAGGYARTDLDAGTAYNADVDTYHGSIYSTYGGESFFLDLALTYGWSSTDEENDVTEGSFDSSLYSAYIGAGYAFDIGNKISITPEASLLASYYDQEGYERTMGILGTGTVKEYDTQSYLGSIGVNLATQHQLDWLNRGIAFIPEVRAHYIHEFNADPDDFTYVIGGTPTPFAVRSRDENLFRFGFGFDMWSWKYANTKFEIDYDLLTSDTYFEQIVSGKATWRF